MKKRFNIKKFIIFILVVIAIISILVIGVVYLVNSFKYKKSFEYKFITLGYTKEEYNEIVNKIGKDNINDIISIGYNENIIKLVNEKYFLYKNLNEYLDYIKENKSNDYTKVISIINTNANLDFLDYEFDTDTSNSDLMLVNRLYALSSDYEPDDLTELSLKISYGGNFISESILDNIINLIDSGKENNYTFVVSQGYRSYSKQEEIYNSYSNSLGKSEADEIVARPGHSEYQTGLCFDLQPYNVVFDDAYSSDEYKWLLNNSYKYGFIIRLPKGKEYITGFNSSAWKLRYVGVEAAKIIYEEDITFEEYYAYYVVGEKSE